MKRILLLVSIILMSSCGSKKFNEKWLKKEAPASFKARFETTKGNFEIEAKREWSPNGVDRLYQLIKNDYYVDVAIFRVVPNFVAQFGIHNDSLINNSWKTKGVKDEPVIQKNDSMTISFARGGVNSRSNQIFINLKENHRLDKLDFSGVTGFPVVAKVISGQENILKFYDGYGDKLGRKQDSISRFGNEFLRKKFPKVDYITKAYILKK
ncbi:peptidylprolyl isomerase [Polaribacter reichenbachii]|uniref:peptidylprolyl isomerase n=1 Tax=Polaribacter reichenbachii TaxID=996801 RepID=A0A1B8TS22_9FLAO|nr:peptidylprolyl isomerase [Polaribacter reichenbachii]APZ44937.1 peptidylprolyl isomerase [Polaribacter reichenbachii]AUC18800.1 peptidylprolyl isomerase [Polaribacter reichenbachii]OBY62369.1 peptidylprolyl isomerase [Polaribacter reichenbachii]